MNHPSQHPGASPNPYAPPLAPMGAPTGPAAPVPPHVAERARTAQRLVTISRWLGWGGLVVLCFGSIGVIVLTRSGEAGGAVALLGMVSATVGAIIGQVGRAMQGRVI